MLRWHTDQDSPLPPPSRGLSLAAVEVVVVGAAVVFCDEGVTWGDS